MTSALLRKHMNSASLCPPSSFQRTAANSQSIQASLGEDYIQHIAQKCLHMGDQDPQLNVVGKIDF
ncbi:hypothetical protein ACHAW6_010045 [Cyclotella cf. meneghiniana]